MDKKKTTKSAETDSFSSQYKDPRWQKKRLEVLEYDEFTCRKCGSTESTLHVHHAFYEKGKSVWEYDTSKLITLCSDCHKRTHELSDMIKEYGVGTCTMGYRTSNIDLLLYLERFCTSIFFSGEDDPFIKDILNALERYEQNALKETIQQPES